MNSPLVQGHHWVYVGPGGGKGMVHRIVACDPDGVITWSVPAPMATAKVAGWSFFGPLSEFNRFFRPLHPPKPVRNAP